MTNIIIYLSMLEQIISKELTSLLINSKLAIIYLFQL